MLMPSSSGGQVYTISIGWWVLQESTAAGDTGPLAPRLRGDRVPEPDKLHGAKHTLGTGSCSLEKELIPGKDTSPSPTQALNHPAQPPRVLPASLRWGHRGEPKPLWGLPCSPPACSSPQGREPAALPTVQLLRHQI